MPELPEHLQEVERGERPGDRVGTLHIDRVDPHWRVSGYSKPLGEAEMFEVAVGDENRRNVGYRVSECLETFDEKVPMAREASIDDSERIVLLDDVPVDSACPESIHPVGDFDSTNEFHSVRTHSNGVFLLAGLSG
ncbi:MAG: hypothetical protein M8354_11345, partial [Halalkalicoccus sp.]|nr:hypothetical protein [Halalkalicoccus sp.]